MERQKKVLDASIMVKWFSKEEDTEKALNLLEKHIAQKIEIIIPELAFIEVVNSLRYKKKKEKEIDEIITALWNLQMTTVELDEEIMKKTSFLVLKNNITIYDALYLAIANRLNTELITADNSLHKLSNVIALKNI